MTFDLGRTDGYPTRYGDQHSPAHADVFTSGLITAFLILGVALFAIIPAYSSLMRRILFCRIFFSLFIGGVILVGNFGHDWERGVIKMSAPYKPGVPDEVEGELGLHIALRGINITLRGRPAEHGGGANNMNQTNHHLSPLAHERIDYNEHFSWEWAQGRFGFGKYAGRISRDFRAAVIRGVPLPILQVAEYFTFDGEGIRFGRHYRLAGWYSHIIMWFAFGTWLIANILFCMVVRTASLFLFITGCLQIAAVGVWIGIRNFIELQIPFQTADGKGEIILATRFGPDLYLVFANGILCILLSGFITLLDALMPDEMCQYFGIDPLTIYDELLLSKDEIKEENRRLTMLQGTSQGAKAGDIEMQPQPELSITSAEGLEVGDEGKSSLYLKRRSNVAGLLMRRSFRQIKPRVARRTGPKGMSSGDSLGEQRVRQSLLGAGAATSESEEGDIQEEGIYSNWPQQAPPTRLAPPAPPPKPKHRS